MDFDNSWTALVSPSKATNHFDGLELEKPRFHDTAYSRTNAIWLAEFSRIIYRDGSAAWPSRNEIYESVGFREAVYHDANQVKFSIIQPLENDAPEQLNVLIFRGTSGVFDWRINLNASLIPWSEGGRVHKGFALAANELWKAVTDELNKSPGQLVIAGHSLGGALAVLTASLLNIPPMSVYTFGAPPLGDADFVDSTSGLRVYRVVNHHDAIARIPSMIHSLNHVGELHWLDCKPPELTSDDTDESSDDGRGQKCAEGARKRYQPVEQLSDHAIVNYIVKLYKDY